MSFETKQMEALALLRKFFDEIETLSEQETDAIFVRLSEISPDPKISDYVFFPDGPEMSPDEIVNKAFSYKAITL
jgi:hypothetical protein